MYKFVVQDMCSLRDFSHIDKDLGAQRLVLAPLPWFRPENGPDPHIHLSWISNCDACHTTWGISITQNGGKRERGWLDSVRHQTRRGFQGGVPAKSSDWSLRSSPNPVDLGENLKFRGDGTLN